MASLDWRDINFIAIEDCMSIPLREQMAFNYLKSCNDPTTIIDRDGLAYCYDGLGWVPDFEY